MQFLVTAWDGTDPQAPRRRLEARPAHLEKARQLKASGNILIGGAMLGDEGQVAGSSLVMEFASRDELDAWLAQEPYVAGGVWEKIQVTPFRVPDFLIP